MRLKQTGENKFQNLDTVCCFFMTRPCCFQCSWELVPGCHYPACCHLVCFWKFRLMQYGLLYWWSVFLLQRVENQRFQATLISFSVRASSSSLYWYMSSSNEDVKVLAEAVTLVYLLSFSSWKEAFIYIVPLLQVSGLKDEVLVQS